jgi:alcohol dehydrogenase, propanol-preferring
MVFKFGMKVARIIKTNEPLKLEDIDVPKPAGEQVLVKVESAGVCHSDLHLWEGGYAGPKGLFMKVEDRGVKFPLTPGHEVAGTITEMGPDVKGFSKGERVLVYPWIGEGSCPACRAGDENLCDAPRSLGVYQDGGYGEYALVPNFKYLVKLGDFDPSAAASLACSGLTAYTAVKKAAVKDGETLVIIGAGGLGLMAVQIAKAITKANVVIVDIDDKKLAEAKRLGADVAVNSGDPVQGVKDLTNGLGAEAVIDFVNNSKTAPNSFNMMRKRGKLVMVGLFGGSMEVNLPLIPLRAFTITGAYTGNYASLVELVDIAKQGKLQSVVSRRFKLEEANAALEELKAGKIIGRAVINP